VRVSTFSSSAFAVLMEMNFSFKGGPEPSEKEIHKILGSKREDRFSDPFFDLVQSTSLVCFSYCFASAISVRPRGTCKSSRRSARR